MKNKEKSIYKNMSKEKKAKPFIKWVGGKRQLLSTILEKTPKTINTYFEPFVGGGALFFNIEAKNKHIADVNPELINTYTVVRDNVEQLIEELSKFENTKEMFLEVRSWDREENFLTKRTDIQRAARFIFLNKTAFNGMWRENKKGFFNVPFGKMKNPTILDSINLRLCSEYLKNTEIECCSFEELLPKIKKGDFVYLDPPYVPISATSSFTSYSKGNFDLKMQESLKEFCDSLDKKGVKFILSNSAAEFVLDLYKDYNVEFVYAKRAINSKGDGRGPVKEVLVSNY